MGKFGRRNRAVSPLGCSLLVGLVLAGVGVGCQRQSTEKITLSGGSLAGAWSAISEGFVTSLRREMPGAAITHELGVDGANAVMVDSGRVELGILHAAMGKLALEGGYPYSQRLENVRAITRVYSDSAFHAVFSADSGLTSIEEIRTRQYPLRLSVNARGTLMEISARTVLEAYGISYEDIESWGGRIFYRTVRPSLELMQAGGLDAVWNPFQFPENNVNEASLNLDLQLVPVSPEVIEYVNRELGTYACTIPGGTYRFAPEDIPTFCDIAILIVHAGLDDEKVYDITQALYRSFDYLHGVHRALARLTPSDMPRVNTVPLHPGAARFYQESGIF